MCLSATGENKKLETKRKNENICIVSFQLQWLFSQGDPNLGSKCNPGPRIKNDTAIKQLCSIIVSFPARNSQEASVFDSRKYFKYGVNFEVSLPN
jgi:hypothetical protein